MPEPISHTSIIAWGIGGVMSLFTTILSFFFRRQIKRIDDHDLRIAGMEKDWVETSHFTESVGRIEKSQNEVHQRVDAIWKHLAEKK
jgi:hypothetical protein